MRGFARASVSLNPKCNAKKRSGMFDFQQGKPAISPRRPVHAKGGDAILLMPNLIRWRIRANP